MDQSPDNQQLNRLRAGDRSVCEELVHAYYERVYRFLLHQTLDSHLAADLTQETFAAAWRGMRQFQGQSSVSTWLHRIAYRKYIDEVRSRNRRRQIQRQLKQNCIEPIESNTPLKKILEDERSRQLYEALEQLDDQQRDVLVLRYLQEMTVQETAEVMDDPPGTTKWRTSDALNRLRALLPREVMNDIRQ